MEQLSKNGIVGGWHFPAAGMDQFMGGRGGVEGGWRGVEGGGGGMEGGGRVSSTGNRRNQGRLHLPWSAEATQQAARPAAPTLRREAGLSRSSHGAAPRPRPSPDLGLPHTVNGPHKAGVSQGEWLFGCNGE